jgi:hypothetical protein
MLSRRVQPNYLALSTVPIKGVVISIDGLKPQFSMPVAYSGLLFSKQKEGIDFFYCFKH